jgi:hypothetical protein
MWVTMDEFYSEKLLQLTTRGRFFYIQFITKYSATFCQIGECLVLSKISMFGGTKLIFTLHRMLVGAELAKLYF